MVDVLMYGTLLMLALGFLRAFDYMVFDDMLWEGLDTIKITFSKVKVNSF